MFTGEKLGKQDFEKGQVFSNFTRQALSVERAPDDLSEAYISTDDSFLIAAHAPPLLT